VKSFSHLYLSQHSTERFARICCTCKETRHLWGRSSTRGWWLWSTVTMQMQRWTNVNCDYTKPDGACQVSLKSSSLATLRFEDGRVVHAKAAYLTMLPTDLVQVKGREVWQSHYEQAFLPFGATKMFMAWEDDMPDAIIRSTRDG
jgi:hypothetical protein